MNPKGVPGNALGPFPAPAKLNLFLHILGQRDDGYHRLQTAFQFLDIHDRLYFSVRDDGRVCRVGGPAGVREEEDLCVRAAKRLREKAGIRQGVTIYCEKNLPVGGGLGGGSSDAATTLVVLNHLWLTGLELTDLASIGLELGADVPVFVHGQAALAEGVGEILTPMALPENWYLVINPGLSVSTADIFSDSELTRDTPEMKIPDLLLNGGRNDCEAVVRRRYPEVAEAIDWLGNFGESRLTGTGACVFAAMPSKEAAERLAGKVPENWSCFVTRGVNESPLNKVWSRV